MTLFTLLIVMAFERVVVKTKQLHITHLASLYFSFASRFLNINTKHDNNEALGSSTTMLISAALPALLVGFLLTYLPAMLVFLLYLLLLWICLGCPATKHTYKLYLQGAARKDYEACMLYSQHFGNENDNLDHVGEQLVFVNYRQYASVIIFFVFLGLPGMVFYSLCKEWFALQCKKSKHVNKNKVQTSVSDDLNIQIEKPVNIAQDNNEKADLQNGNVNEEQNDYQKNLNDVSKVMFLLDWLPSRITAFGFLLVGHFTNGLPVWLNTFTHSKQSAYMVLSKVAIASEEAPSTEQPELYETLQLVRLAKRNIIFLLMVISVMTLLGVIS